MKLCINYEGFARMLNCRIPVERDYKTEIKQESEINSGFYKLRDYTSKLDTTCKQKAS
jgi:hypothetical protein